MVFSQTHKSPFETGSVKDADGVRGSDRRSRNKASREAQEGVGKGNGAVEFRGYAVAGELAGLGGAGLCEPEEGMTGDGNGKQLTEQVGEKIVAAQVGEFVGEDSFQFRLRERGREIRRQQDERARDAESDGTGDSR